MSTSDKSLSIDDVTALIKAKVDEYGGVSNASKAWGITVQMTYAFLRGAKRPRTAKMLADIGVEEVSSEITYRLVTVGEKRNVRKKNEVESTLR